MLHHNNIRTFVKCRLLLSLLLCTLLTLTHAETANGPPGNKIIIEWNHLAYTIANQHDQFYSFIGVRALTMMHLAMHDCLNAVDPQFQTYALSESNADVDPALAMITAARDILVASYPQRQDTIEAFYHQWMERLPKKSKMSTELGKKAAAKLLKMRQGDGHEKQGSYTPMTKPGDYQYTPGFDYVWIPDFSFATPFALKSHQQFRSPPPPALTSKSYTDSYLEVMAYGQKNSTVRSKDQTHYAHWWAEFGEHGWNRIARLSAQGNSLSLHQTARLFALINMNLYDLYLASFDSKYHYDTWRPYTAIRNGATDGNPDTPGDPSWEPEMVTPPWPEYPSAHAAVGAGGAEIVSSVFGTPKVEFEMISTSALPNKPDRKYRDLDQAANDCADSRIMNGFHFRFATKEGKRQGRQVASYILSNFLQPLNTAAKTP